MPGMPPFQKKIRGVMSRHPWEHACQIWCPSVALNVLVLTAAISCITKSMDPSSGTRDWPPSVLNSRGLSSVLFNQFLYCLENAFVGWRLCLYIWLLGVFVPRPNRGSARDLAQGVPFRRSQGLWYYTGLGRSQFPYTPAISKPRLRLWRTRAPRTHGQARNIM